MRKCMGLKCILSSGTRGKFRPFFQCYANTAKRWVCSRSRHPELFRSNPQIRVAAFNMQRNPCFRVWPETHQIPLIQLSLLKKGVVFLQNDALIAILIVKGREVVFLETCDELCRVVG